MLSFLKKKRPSSSGPTPKEAFFQEFLALPHHEWIRGDRYLVHAFSQLFDRLNENQLAYFRTQRTYFLPANAQYSCSLGLSEKCFVIIVFPDLLRSLKALVPTQGLAILAHELGHVYHQHYRRQVNALEAQIEADEFAFNLGLGHELQDVLLQYPESEECQARINVLTTRLSQKDN